MSIEPGDRSDRWCDECAATVPHEAKQVMAFGPGGVRFLLRWSCLTHPQPDSTTYSDVIPDAD